MEVLGRAFRVSAGSFFQVNTRMAEAMVTHLLEVLPLSPEKTVLDLYCGAGLFSAFFAPRVAQVIGVEAAPSACEDFVVNLDEYENVSLYEGEAGMILPALDACPDIVVVDPPRAGLEKPALDALLKLAPPVLAYVSCDPATLARDAKRLLAGGYRLEQITPFDLFPQTYHIESISIFRGD
jgi:23S rRNA (uracil1939-C5)-methyltransferase